MKRYESIVALREDNDEPYRQDEMLSTVARELCVSEEDLVRQGIRSVLDTNSVRLNLLEIGAITGPVSMSSFKDKPAIRMEIWTGQLVA